MSGSAPSDIMRTPGEVDALAGASLPATALATWLHTSCPNVTDYNQNYSSSMFAFPAAMKWSGNEVRQPNVTEAKLYPPKPSSLAKWFGGQLQRIQDSLAGAP